MSTMTLEAPTRRVFLPRRAPAARPVITENRGAEIDPFLRQVSVRAGGRIETTRLIDPEDPEFVAELSALEKEGFEWTCLHQARALIGAADFPKLSASFVARGDVFYGPNSRGEARNCHAKWNHLLGRFEMVDASSAAEAYAAMTKVEYP